MNEANTANIEVKLLTAKQVAKLMQVSIRHVRRLNTDGLMPAPLRLGGNLRWNKDEILGWVDAGVPDRETWKQMKAERKG